MTCETFDVLAVDLDRGEAMEPSVRDEALAHVRGCARCAARLEDERAVTGALRELAARTEAEEPPPRVEWALRRALREAAGAGDRRRRVTGVRFAAAGLVVSAAALAVMAVVQPGSLPQGRAGRAPRPVTTASPASVPGGDAPFISLNYADDLRDMDSLQVVQIEMPRTALAAFGWPVGDPQAGVVTAEVIVGYDGVARGIRMVE